LPEALPVPIATARPDAGADARDAAPRSGGQDSPTLVPTPAAAPILSGRKNGADAAASERRDLDEAQLAVIGKIESEILREHVRFALERGQPLDEYVTADSQIRAWVRSEIAG
jgi:hypothetical protein